MNYFFLLSTFEHNDASQQMAADVRLALARAGMSMKQAALEQGLDEAQWTRQLEGHGAHVSLWRLSSLPPCFWSEFIPILASRNGLAVASWDLAELMADVRTLIGKKRMAKVLPVEQRQERAS